MTKRRPVQRLIALGPADAPAPREPLFYSQGEAARQLHIGVETLKRWIDAGIIFAIPTGKHHKKIPIAEVQKFKEGRYAFDGYGAEIRGRAGHDVARTPGPGPGPGDGEAPV